VGRRHQLHDFGVVLPAIGRAAAPEQRSMAMGLASAGGSLGQMLLVPFAKAFGHAGTNVALLALAAVIVITRRLGYSSTVAACRTRRSERGRRRSGAHPAPCATVAMAC